MIRIKHILLATAVVSSLGLFAQHNEEVTIEGTYRPKINKVDKILMKAEMPEHTFEMPSTEVGVLDIEHRFPLELEKLSAMPFNVKGSLQETPTKNFLMAGMGTRLSPVFFYKHNSMLTKTLGLGVGIKHYSSWLDIKDYAPSGFMNNAFDISLFSKQSDKLQFKGNVYYKNDVVHYYGVRKSEWMGTEAALEKATPRQAYNTIGMHFESSSTTTRLREISEEAAVDYHYMYSGFGNTEHFFGLNFRTTYSNNWWGGKNNPQTVGLDFGFTGDVFKSVNTTVSPGSRMALFYMKPFIEMKDDYYRLHLGFALDTKGSALNGDSRITMHPDLRGSLYVLDKTVEFYAGLNGGRHVNTYSEVVGKNPFVGDALDLLLTNVKLGFEGGVRTNIMNTLDMHLGVRYRHTDNDPFYTVLGQMIDNQWVNNTFTLFYDETKVVSLLADARWLAVDRLTVDAGFTYNNYRMELLDQPLYRPATEGRLKVNYDFDDNLAIYSSFLYQGGRYARLDSPLLTTPSFKLKPVLDLGIGADYKVKDELTVFGKVDNLLHQKYQLFANYPVTGIQLFAGVKMRF
ncbi:MAG: hypothetical protein IKT08_06125 [Bacteroidales bacterium]|nr:hypothetical protein [Bacteroidales bacterium]